MSFRHQGLRELFETGRSRKVRPDLQKRCLRALDALNVTRALLDLKLPGFGVHPLKGDRAGRHALSVGQPWRLTFRWDDGTVSDVDLEQYH